MGEWEAGGEMRSAPESREETKVKGASPHLEGGGWLVNLGMYHSLWEGTTRPCFVRKRGWLMFILSRPTSIIPVGRYGIYFLSRPSFPPTPLILSFELRETAIAEAAQASMEHKIEKTGVEFHQEAGSKPALGA